MPRPEYLVVPHALEVRDPRQALGMAVPIERFSLAGPQAAPLTGALEGEVIEDSLPSEHIRRVDGLEALADDPAPVEVREEQRHLWKRRPGDLGERQARGPHDVVGARIHNGS